MAQALPRFIALGSGMQYLQYEAAEGVFHRRVRVRSRMVASEGVFTKFEVVGSSFRNMIHIRTCYNNKFLTLERHPSTIVGTDANWLAATADEVEEDTSKSSCTLFRYVYDNNNRLALFLQADNTEHPIVLSMTYSLVSGRNYSGPTTTNLFGVEDLQTLVILPRHVSFIGDNDMYLRSLYIRLNNRLQFGMDNRLDSTVHFEATTLNNGDVQLRSPTFDGQLWRKSNAEWILCDTRDTNDRNTIFRPVRLSNQGKSAVALLNVSNNKNCMRWIRGGQPRLIDTLTASSNTSTVDSLAVMSVEEAIRDREIYNIQYRMDEARVYNVRPLLAVPQTVNNFSQTQTQVTTLGYSYEKVTQETFSSSHSWKISYTATLNVTVIPVFVEGNIELNAQYEGEVKWSEMREERQTVHTSVQVSVPPRTRVVVTMMVGRGSIDVPYRYTQRDILLNGNHETRTFEDGLFVGLNTHVFEYDVREEKLPDNAVDNTPSSLDDEQDEETVVVRHYVIKPERAPKAAAVLESDEKAEATAVVPSKL